MSKTSHKCLNPWWHLNQHMFNIFAIKITYERLICHQNIWRFILFKSTNQLINLSLQFCNRGYEVADANISFISLFDLKLQLWWDFYHLRKYRCQSLSSPSPCRNSGRWWDADTLSFATRSAWGSWGTLWAACRTTPVTRHTAAGCTTPLRHTVRRGNAR